MSRLKAIDPKDAAPSKPKIVIFGKPGAGKTWTTLDFPSVYFIDTEGGADLPRYTAKLKASGGAYLGPEQGSLSFDTLLDQVQALATEKHPFRTLAIDSISKLFMLEVAREAERLGDADEYGASKKPAVGYMRRLVSWLSRLDMNVILVAHETGQWGLDRKKRRAQVGVTFDAWDKLEYELHLSLRIFRDGKKRLAQVCKTRLGGFPEDLVFPWGYPDFAQRYDFGRDVMERDSQQLALATAEQLAEVRRLIDVVRLAEGQVEKWFGAANVTCFEEMDTARIEKCIGYMRAKIAASDPASTPAPSAEPNLKPRAKANGVDHAAVVPFADRAAA